jgi:hypothetical protein
MPIIPTLRRLRIESLRPARATWQNTVSKKKKVEK